MHVTNPDLDYEVYVRAGQLGQLSTGVNDTLAGQHVSEADTFDFESRRGERDVRARRRGWASVCGPCHP